MAVHKLHDTTMATTLPTSTTTDVSGGHNTHHPIANGKPHGGKHELPQKFVEQYEHFAKEVSWLIMLMERKSLFYSAKLLAL